MIRLSEEDKTLLYLTQLGALESVPELAAKTGESEHATRRRLSKLKNNNLIRRMPILNLSVVGYSRYKIFFSGVGSKVERSSKQKTKLFDAIVRHPRTLFLADMGGQFQASLIFIAKNLREVHSYLNFFAEEYEGTFVIDNVSPIYGHSFLGTGALAPSLRRPPALEWHEVDQREELDEVGRTILYHFCNDRVDSVTDLARKVKMPPTTVRYRLTVMEEQGIIAGYFNAFDPVDVGMFPFFVLLSLQGVTTSVEQKLRAICDSRPEVDMLSRYLGAYDFAILCFVESARGVTPLVDALQEAFGSQIKELSTLPQFHTHIWTEFNISRSE